MNVVAKQISGSSIFKIYFLGGAISSFFIFFIMGLFSIFGEETVFVNEHVVTGFMGFFTAMLMWLFFSLFFSGLMWMSSIFGLWIYSLIKPISISFRGVIALEPEDEKYMQNLVIKN